MIQEVWEALADSNEDRRYTHGDGSWRFLLDDTNIMHVLNKKCHFKNPLMSQCNDSWTE